MPHAYMLRCADGSYYAGSTVHLDQRLREHNSPDLGAVYTRKRRPVELVWSAQFDSIADAFAFEKRIQGWSRAKREALIRGDFDALRGLARRGPLRTSPGFEAPAGAAAPQPPDCVLPEPDDSRGFEAPAGAAAPQPPDSVLPEPDDSPGFEAPARAAERTTRPPALGG